MQYSTFLKEPSFTGKFWMEFFCPYFSAYLWHLGGHWEKSQNLVISYFFYRLYNYCTREQKRKSPFQHPSVHLFAQIVLQLYHCTSVQLYNCSTTLVGNKKESLPFNVHLSISLPNHPIVISSPTWFDNWIFFMFVFSLWTQGVVPYKFSPAIEANAEMRAVIFASMQEWMQKTCIR